MAKPTKKPTKKAADRDPQALRNHIANIEERLRGLANRNDANSLTKEMRLGRLYAQFLEIQRKQDKEAAKRTEAYTRAGVMQWLREQEPSERASFLREGANIDSKRSGLA